VTGRRRLLLLVLALSGVACDAMREGQLEPGGPYADGLAGLGSGGQRSMAVAVSTRLQVNGIESDFRRGNFSTWETPVLQAYRTSHYFDEVEPGFESKDLRAQVRVMERMSYPATSEKLTEWTLWLWPSFRKTRFEMETTFVDASGRPRGKIVKTETIHYVDQLFAMWITGVTNMRARVSNEVYDDLVRTTLIEAAQRGWLRPSEAAP
jgi:hypothetical protein